MTATREYRSFMQSNCGLIKFMAANGLTVSGLARDIGVNKSVISRISRGLAHPSKKTIDQILEVCRAQYPTVTYEDLFQSGGGCD